MENVTLESFLIPFFKPKMTETHAIPVMIQMIKPFGDCQSLGSTLLLRRAMVVAIVVTPSPRDAHAERRARDGQGVDRAAKKAVDVLTQKRVETGANRHRTTVSVANDAQRDGHEDVRNPTMKAPVEEREGDRLLRSLIVIRDGDLLRVE